MGIAQIALDPPTPLSNVANVEKKSASPHSNRQMWEKVLRTILASLYTPHPPLLSGNAHCPYGNNTFKKGLPQPLNDVLNFQYNEDKVCLVAKNQLTSGFLRIGKV